MTSYDLIILSLNRLTKTRYALSGKNQYNKSDSVCVCVCLSVCAYSLCAATLLDKQCSNLALRTTSNLRR